MQLEEYTNRHAHMLAAELPPLLADAMTQRRIGHLVDLGAGDGASLWALRGRYDTGTAVDLASGRIERVQRMLPEVQGVVADACDTGLPAESADCVVCSQVIEHVPDEAALATEVRRLLSPGGWFYIGSVLRARHAFWFYRRDGRWWLDPTHLREYASTGELTSVLTNAGLELQDVRVSPCSFPVMDMALRVAVATRLMSPDSAGAFYVRRPRGRTLRRFTFQPPGYFMIETIGTRSPAPAPAGCA